MKQKTEAQREKNQKAISMMINKLSTIYEFPHSNPKRKEKWTDFLAYVEPADKQIISSILQEEVV